MKILDLCTGTGCIPLLTYYEFCNKYRRDAKDMEVVGVDISPTALALANQNLQKLIGERMIPPKANLQFLQADILASKDEEVGNGVKSLMTELKQHTSTSTSETNPGNGNWDILISNPPYISPSAFNHTTTRSVKKYEPRLALVPPPIQSPTTASLHPKSLTTQHFNPHSLNPDQDQDQGDLFYPHLLTIATAISAKVILFEVADLEQAKIVAEMARRQGSWDGVEIWRDDPIANDDHEEDYREGEGDRVEEGGGKISGEGEGEMMTKTETELGIKVLGRGNGRTVVAYRGEGKNWMCAKA
jgi:methylase of polypeptide subunit release factors